MIRINIKTLFQLSRLVLIVSCSQNNFIENMHRGWDNANGNPYEMPTDKKTNKCEKKPNFQTNIWKSGSQEYEDNLVLFGSNNKFSTNFNGSAYTPSNSFSMKNPYCVHNERHVDSNRILQDSEFNNCLGDLTVGKINKEMENFYVFCDNLAGIQEKCISALYDGIAIVSEQLKAYYKKITDKDSNSKKENYFTTEVANKIIELIGENFCNIKKKLEKSCDVCAEGPLKSFSEIYISLEKKDDKVDNAVLKIFCKNCFDKESQKANYNSSYYAGFSYKLFPHLFNTIDSGNSDNSKKIKNIRSLEEILDAVEKTIQDVERLCELSSEILKGRPNYKEGAISINEETLLSEPSEISSASHGSNQEKSKLEIVKEEIKNQVIDFKNKLADVTNIKTSEKKEKSFTEFFKNYTNFANEINIKISENRNFRNQNIYCMNFHPENIEEKTLDRLQSMKNSRHSIVSTSEISRKSQSYEHTCGLRDLMLYYQRIVFMIYIVYKMIGESTNEKLLTNDESIAHKGIQTFFMNLDYHDMGVIYEILNNEEENIKFKIIKLLYTAGKIYKGELNDEKVSLNNILVLNVDNLVDYNVFKRTISPKELLSPKDIINKLITEISISPSQLLIVELVMQELNCEKYDYTEIVNTISMYSTYTLTILKSNLDNKLKQYFSNSKIKMNILGTQEKLRNSNFSQSGSQAERNNVRLIESNVREIEESRVSQGGYPYNQCNEVKFNKHINNSRNKEYSIREESSNRGSNINESRVSQKGNSALDKLKKFK